VLKQIFIQLISNYTSDERKKQELWNEIELNYSYKKRHYHTLEHLENLLQQLLEVKTDINDWNCILFSLFYHDVIYNPLKTSNEERSAEFVAYRMKTILVSEPIIAHCVNQIIATKKHAVSDDSDTNYFTDADLSILGQPWEVYSTYYKQVRKEYSLFPELIYVPGRKKVLQQFLQMERIFKTDFFYKKFELQAKENLKKELALL
jgi:predicted metal-dependent HD superfamily phosphohydrolase